MLFGQKHERRKVETHAMMKQRADNSLKPSIAVTSATNLDTFKLSCAHFLGNECQYRTNASSPELRHCTVMPSKNCSESRK